MALINDNLVIRSSLDRAKMTNLLSLNFGPPGASNYQAHPGQREATNLAKVFQNMAKAELAPLPDIKILKGTVYSFKNRRIITKWIRDVCAAFKLKSSTFNLSVQLADAFIIRNLQKLPVNECQLGALAAIWVSAKFEEQDPAVPTLQGLVDVCDRAYSKSQIIDMEEAMLVTFKFRVPHTTATNFLYFYLHCVANSDVADRPALPGAPAGMRLMICQSASGQGSGQRDITAGAAPPMIPEVVALNVTNVDLPFMKQPDIFAPAFGGKAPPVSVADGGNAPPGSRTLDLYQLHGDSVFLATRISATTTPRDVLAKDPAAVIYATTAAESATVFAERNGTLLLRTPNAGLLRTADLLLREALIHVNLLSFAPHELGLAALLAGLCMSGADTADDAALAFKAIRLATGLKPHPQLRAAVALILEKYDEAVRGMTPEAAAGLPLLPATIAQRLDRVVPA